MAATTSTVTEHAARQARTDDRSTSAPLQAFAAGQVIPAQPLALTADRSLDEQRQRALSRYYLAAGAGGIAVGVHSTEFAIHDTHRELLRPVLELAADVVAAHGRPDTILIAGLAGPTATAVEEAELAAGLGYHAVLAAPYGADDLDEAGLLDRVRAIGEVLPVIGFYLQPSVGGRVLTRDFWRELADVESVIGVKAAPFDRYRTADVVYGVADSDRSTQVALYTGNDDHIIGDLTAGYATPAHGELTFVGGLLGQWSLWVHEAVRILALAKRVRSGDLSAWPELRRIDPMLTDANAAIFDARHDFAGCLPGIHEVLRRQGLLAGTWCLDPDETMSPGQLDEIDRVWRAYPQLRDDTFVAEHLDYWMR